MSLVLILSSATATFAATPCTTNIDCSLNGLCTAGTCVCDKPWGGSGCGTLQYLQNQSVLAKNLYPHNDTDAPKSGPCVTKAGSCDALNTWNGKFLPCPHIKPNAPFFSLGFWPPTHTLTLRYVHFACHR